MKRVVVKANLVFCGFIPRALTEYLCNRGPWKSILGTIAAQHSTMCLDLRTRFDLFDTSKHTDQKHVRIVVCSRRESGYVGCCKKSLVSFARNARRGPQSQPPSQRLHSRIYHLVIDLLGKIDPEPMPVCFSPSVFSIIRFHSFCLSTCLPQRFSASITTWVF